MHASRKKNEHILYVLFIRALTKLVLFLFDRQFNNVQDELYYYRNYAENLEHTLQDTKSALDEFQISSRELEEELEKELFTTEKAYKELKSQCERSKGDADQWKTKFTDAKHEQNITMMQMQREIDVLRATEAMFRKKILDLELDNDDLERTERAASSSLSDLEVKLNKTIERNIILENEIISKDQLTEQTQRLKDELNEANQELSVLHTKTSEQQGLMEEMENRLEIETKNANKLHHTSPTSHPHKSVQYYYESYTPRRPRHSRNTSSTATGTTSVKMVQEMVGRVKSLEARLQSCRSLVTPLLNHPSSYNAILSPNLLPNSGVMQLTKLGAPRRSGSMAMDLCD
ncbi:hypothetical protein BCR42DRAFT_362601 [Absidia repens]|uniref:NUDE domain-containing protein n=1 Tax=Absidia repens TaxID=90262 RepID=A0A1X2HLC5_9FUNG|nr:hypothetical protein BCR42DRAFT_362601 [Absidia repens]